MQRVLARASTSQQSVLQQPGTDVGTPSISSYLRNDGKVLSEVMQTDLCDVDVIDDDAAVTWFHHAEERHGE